MLAARRGNMQKPCTVGSDSIDAAGLKMSWRTFEAWLYVAGLELLKSNQDRSWLKCILSCSGNPGMKV